MAEQADIAIIGVGVMGSNLALNMAENGATVALYDLDAEKPRRLSAENFPGKLIPCADLGALAEAVRPPRPFVMLAPAGEAVDALIAEMSPLIGPGDILIDAGNSNFRDTQRRMAEVESRGHAFLGMGVSGGAEGARHGPAIMAGGSRGVWDRVAPVFEKIAAKYDGDPCAGWFGPDGAGHFVKAAHNGIEYAFMQMIAEAYGIMRDGLGMEAGAIGEVFHAWNTGPLDCYLIEITAKALSTIENGVPIVDLILDSAGQKGTGRWTAIEGQHVGAPVTTVEAALIARNLSSRRDERLALEAIYGAVPTPVTVEGVVDALHGALIAGKIIAYAQGFVLIEAASDENEWDVDLTAVAKVWRAGCIIRSALLGDMAEVLSDGSLLTRDPFTALLKAHHTGLRETVATAAQHGLPSPALSAALTWFDMIRTGRSTANMIQAQRDFFGAHGFERVDREGKGHHGDWSR